MQKIKKQSIGALILASGKGERVQTSVPKQFLMIGTKTILELVLNKFIAVNIFENITVVINEQHDFFLKNIKIKYKNVNFIFGGKSRQKSCYNGLEYIRKKNPVDKIVIHDAARPNLNKTLLKRICSKLKNKNAIIPIIRCTDSVKEVDGNYITKSVSRDKVYLSQTPQGFDAELLLNEYKKIKEKDLINYTDDAQIYANNNKDLYTIEGDESNFKITTVKNFEYFKFINQKNSMIIVGHGIDVHRFTNGTQIKLFGVKIPFNKSLKGHSDADVGIHSIIDSILGGLALGDIGKLFPNNDKKYKNIDSTKLLREVVKLIEQTNSEIIHIDNTVMCEKPKIQKFIPEMRIKISKILKISENAVSIKATTTEKLGFLGREEGICSTSIVTLRRDKSD